MWNSLKVYLACEFLEELLSLSVCPRRRGNRQELKCRIVVVFLSPAPSLARRRCLLLGLLPLESPSPLVFSISNEYLCPLSPSSLPPTSESSPGDMVHPVRYCTAVDPPCAANPINIFQPSPSPMSCRDEDLGDLGTRNRAFGVDARWS